jgi:translation initiation factor 4G
MHCCACVCDAGMLLAFFDTLYHEDVVTDDAYFQWEQSNDPQEQNGRGAAKMSVVQFIAWLKEADDEADN